MSTVVDTTGRAPTEPSSRQPRQPRGWEIQRGGIEALLIFVGVIWLVEVINAIGGYGLNNDGIYPRSVSHLWGVLTAPFIHASFSHIIGNTVPLVFMGLIIALRGAKTLIQVTLFVIIVGGLGTWLIGPSHTDAIGASGVVFGYATYLIARGFFSRSVLELLAGVIVIAVFGSALLSSLVPHGHISWQGHLCGGIAGVLAAWLLARNDPRRVARRGRASGATAPALPK